MRIYWVDVRILRPHDCSPVPGLYEFDSTAWPEYPKSWKAICEVFNQSANQLVRKYAPFVSTTDARDAVNSGDEFSRHLATLQRDQKVGADGLSDIDALGQDMKAAFGNEIAIDVQRLEARQCLICKEELKVISDNGKHGACSVCLAPYSKERYVDGQLWQLGTWTCSIRADWIQNVSEYWRSAHLRLPPLTNEIKGTHGIPGPTTEELEGWNVWMSQYTDKMAKSASEIYKTTLEALA